MKNIESQLFSDQNLAKTQGLTTIQACDSESKKLEMNVHVQVEKLNSSSTLIVDSKSDHFMPSLQPNAANSRAST